MNMRPYNPTQDQSALFDLLHACRRADQIDRLLPLHLEEALKPGSFLASPHLDLTQDTRLWFYPDDRLAAFSLVDLHSWGLLYLVDPDISHADIETTLIAWGIERARAMVAGQQAKALHCRAVRLDKPQRARLLEKAGFSPINDPMIRLVRPLDQPIPPPILPPGFTFSHVTALTDLAAYIDMGNTAFPNAFRIESHRQFTALPQYRAPLDLVVLNPQQRPVALCQCYYDSRDTDQNPCPEGFTDPVGTHPDFRRQGLARAVILEGLHRLRACGLQAATLQASAANKVTRHLYSSLGYQEQYCTATYAYPLE
ncbi:MAG: GNAT family N-acetyltransferase [Candidatus Latescibacteria bacterium]|nr:GNAT family N-acetyltransferase [Candidatus Latescibacterota bacterium]